MAPTFDDVEIWQEIEQLMVVRFMKIKMIM